MVKPSKSSIKSRISKLSSTSTQITFKKPASESVLAFEKIINYRQELTAYFFNEMLPFVVDTWTKTDEVDMLSQGTSMPSKASSKMYRLSTVERRSTDNSNFNSISTLPEERKKQIDQYNEIFDRLQEAEKSSDSVKSKSSKRISGSFRKMTTLSSTLPIIKEIDTQESFTQKSNLEFPIYDWFVSVDEFRSVFIQFKNGNSYIGPVRRRLMHGKGLFRWDDGALYQGEFCHGEITGQGILTYNDLSYYIGHFCNGLLHGTGSFYPMNSSLIYDGNWKHGKKHGKGWLLYGRNNFYEGEWYEDIKQGVGYRSYKTGDVYNGDWFNGKPHGKGIMRFHNNDLYIGDWENGLPSGYGEYTWNCYLQPGIAFSNENIYQGAWKDGKRHGFGIIHFGIEGSKLACVFKENKKHGAGIMICGDGTIIEKNPFFENDSPLDKLKFKNKVKVSTNKDSASALKKSTTSSVKLQFRSEKVLGKRNIYVNKIGLQENKKVDSLFPTYDSKCQPIEIPIHGNPLQMNLSYHIQKLIDLYNDNLIDQHDSMKMAHSLFNMMSPSKTHITMPESNYLNEQKIHFEFEERKLRNIITLNYNIFENLYKKYASLTTNPDNDCIMSRLFLWQMYKDLNISDFGCSLIDVDLIMLEVADISLETEHNPFEKIYFWQFMHSILEMANKRFANEKYFDENKGNGIFATMLRDFLGEYIIPNVGKFNGKCLFKYLDLTPVTAVYGLYQTLGEPHSVRKFLRTCCVKSDEEPLCTLRNIEFDPNENLIGYNYVCSSNNMIFIPQSPPAIGEKPKEPIPYPIEKDGFYKNLKVFRKLGPKKILEFVSQICPLVKKESFVLYIDYQLTFLEFFEILILCAEALLEANQVREEKKVVGTEDKKKEHGKGKGKGKKGNN